MQFASRTQKGGFTLIEVLVVIAIIGILASIVFVSLNSARVRARDAKRRESLKAIDTALESYYAQNNSYPTSGWASSLSGTSYIPQMVPTYFAQLPQDSGPGQCGGGVGDNSSLDRAYWYISDGTGFKATACPEDPVPASDPMYDTVRPGYVLQVCADSPSFSCSSR